MLNDFFFVGLPYIALASLVGGSIIRFRLNRFSYSALSSQFLENRRLLWGSVPWHIGILIILLGHLAAFLAPGVWTSLMSVPALLYAVEAIGLASAILSVAGLVVLILRRVLSARLQAVSTSMDYLILTLLIAQVILGIGVAMAHRWGSQWAGGTVMPYLWSLLTFQPVPELVTELPAMVKLHLILAFVIFLLLPFSRLVHFFSLPIEYLARPFIKVVWNNPRRFQARDALAAITVADDARRTFIKGALATGAAVTLLSVGVMDKMVRFFRGPSLEPHQQAELLDKRLARLEQTAAQRKLELERMKNEHIFVAPLAQLLPAKGLYFTDYQMRPALAFRGADGMPLLISAKCTHLGCTVASEADNQGRLLCPCHISYFDIQTGQPNTGAPAKAPLPHIGWTLIDPQGRAIATRAPGKPVEHLIDAPPELLDTCSVFISKKYEGDIV